MKKLALVIVVLAILTTMACVGTPPANPPVGQARVNPAAPSATSPATTAPTATPTNAAASTTASTTTSTTTSTSQAAPDAVLAEIEALHTRAKTAVLDNRLTEAIKLYISAMVRAQRNYRALFETLNQEIATIGARLTLEPSEAWMGTNGEQITGNTREANNGQGLMPAVYLYENYGSSKATVGDAVIRFEFTENEGTLLPSVSTDRFGLANTTISNIARTGQNATVRAFPVFTNEGFSYAFREVFRDFVYLAPQTVVLVTGMERSSSGQRENPQSIDILAQAIKDLGLDVIPHNGQLSADQFNTAFSGNPSALAQLNTQSTPGYFALLLIEVNQPIQLAMGGTTYNIFNTTGRLTVRIVRSDGSVVHSLTKDNVRGQGGNVEAAISDCVIRMRLEMTQLITANREAIQRAFME